MKKIKYILLSAMVLLLCGCSAGRKNISISPYIMTSVSGLSGRATATVYLDTEGIYSALAGVTHLRMKKQNMIHLYHHWDLHVIK